MIRYNKLLDGLYMCQDEGFDVKSSSDPCLKLFPEVIPY